MKSRETKRTEAQQRQAIRDERTELQQANALDERLGAGVGAERERLKLRTSSSSSPATTTGGHVK